MSESLTPHEQKMFAERSDAEPGAAEPAATPAPEGAAAPETAPAPAEPTAEPKAAETEPPKTVRLEALHEERERRREANRLLEVERRERAAEQARMDERLRAIQDRLAPLAETPLPKVPDFQQDPQGNIQGQFALLQRQLADTQQQLQHARSWQEQQMLQQQQHAQQMELVNRATAYGRQNEAEFSKATPDYLDAAAHLRASREGQLRALGVNEAMIAQQIQQETLQVAAMAMNEGRNFAETIYNVALAAGYTPKQAKAQVAAAVAAPAPPENPLATVERGQRLAQGLGSAGSAPPKIPSAEALANMSIEQFAEYLAKFPDQAADAMR